MILKIMKQSSTIPVDVISKVVSFDTNFTAEDKNLEEVLTNSTPMKSMIGTSWIFLCNIKLHMRMRILFLQENLNTLIHNIMNIDLRMILA